MSVHISIMRQLFIESGEINERIHCGDICSAKTGLIPARKLCDRYEKILRAEKCEQVKIEPYVAYGGWIGLTYSYDFDNEPFVGSLVVRTLA
jgi:hypothetical protein